MDTPARDMGARYDESGSPASRGRRIAFSVLAAVFAAAALGGLFGIGLVIGWFDDDAGGIHRVHDIGFGVLFGVIVSVGFAALVARPERRPSAYLQATVAAVAALLAGLISADWGYLSLGLPLVAALVILLVLHPTRETVLHPTLQPSAAMTAVALVGAIPLVGFAVTAARLQRDGLAADPHVSMSHWATMSAMALGLVFTGLLASTRIRGWRLTAWCAGIGAATYGLASIVFARFPGSEVPYPGSEGSTWGAVAVAGGLVFIAVAEWEARRRVSVD